jgi:hypothetical protein
MALVDQKIGNGKMTYLGTIGNGGTINISATVPKYNQLSGADFVIVAGTATASYSAGAVPNSNTISTPVPYIAYNASTGVITLANASANITWRHSDTGNFEWSNTASLTCKIYLIENIEIV